MIDYQWAIVPLLAFASAWGGARVTLNGTKARVEKLEAYNVQVLDRLARIETKIDMMVKENR